MAKRDYYEILGVPKGASADEIRKAYRKLARELHPDVNKSADAQARFTEVQQAYDVLNDDPKRKAYDTYGHEARSAGPAPGPGQHYSWQNAGGADFDPDDISSVFESIFGGGGAMPDMGAAQRGAKGRARRPRGRPQPEEIEHEIRVPFSTVISGGTEQLRISGGGKARTIEVKIPKGMADGAQLRVRGGADGGDILLTVRTDPHPHFRRGEHEETGKGLDLYLDLPLTIAEATLGAAIPVPTPAGTVELTIPAGTASEKKLRLRGKGLSDAEGRHGDFFVVTRIVPPGGAEMTATERAELERISSRTPAVRIGQFWPSMNPSSSHRPVDK